MLPLEVILREKLEDAELRALKGRGNPRNKAGLNYECGRVDAFRYVLDLLSRHPETANAARIESTT